MLHGIDVSSNNPDTYSTSGLSFAFVKATEGAGYVNEKQPPQTQTGRSAGLVLGFYHFLRPGDPDVQAQFFVRKCLSVPGDILACDWESESGTAPSCAEKDRFLAAVKQLRPDHKVVLYCNLDFWLNHDTTSDCGDGLWIADPSRPEGKPAVQHPWLFHQYGDGTVDRDVANFAAIEHLRQWAGTPSGGGQPVPQPQLEPFPGSGFFVGGRRSPIIAAMHDRLVAEGCDRYQTSTDKDVWGSGDQASYAAWQRKLGYSGSAADGIPGATSWDKLQVPKV